MRGPRVPGRCDSERCTDGVVGAECDDGVFVGDGGRRSGGSPALSNKPCVSTGALGVKGSPRAAPHGDEWAKLADGGPGPDRGPSTVTSGVRAKSGGPLICAIPVGKEVVDAMVGATGRAR
ncbi:hypothetical protein GSI_00298 [Ganoderma sinense ZZ0214-1]|uniref:Uncharacterized protein n=1 Tax=Ganoderma sinense ZZ0214-1 TaxID=1077348 RepID=A0A2G8SS63_9APHY|nr:hypothetical protein GSI_00298 [Ganoderma sinense ZZ0214-1]